MRSRHIVFAVISLLSFYGCGGSSPGNRDAADGPVDTSKDTPADKATDGAGGTGGDAGPGADAKDAPDLAVDTPKVDAPTDGTDGGGDVGGPPACTVASQCPGQDSECQHRTCTAGVCGLANEATGKVLATQVIGDCRVRQCAADGTIAIIIDDKDIPDDLNACTKDACTAGVASHAPLAKDTACGGGKLCNATGQCVGCNTAADCPGTDNFCRTRTCVQNTCGVTFKTLGTKLIDDASGDCKIQQCDGAGVIQTVASPTDLPVDNNLCTLDECNGTTPTHQPVARNTSCGGAQICDGASHCVTCLTPTTCPGTDTECQSRTCINGACGVAFAPAGKATSAQSTGDCTKKQCNGNGGIVSVIDNTDPLVDNNPCTKDQCDNGTSSNPPLPARTNCGPNLQCDGKGLCVSCLTPADCPGTDNECQARTCTLGRCGIAFKAAGTAVSSQTSGDCKQNQCDGRGATVTVSDDTDPQNDNNPCTNDICSGGVNQHPNVAPKVSCGTPKECDGSGHCVGCIQASECGINTECLTNTCIGGTCGTTFAARGAMVSIQVGADCRKNQCDGSGNVESVPDNSDSPPDDGNQCTMDVCVNGAPAHPAVMGAMTCNQTGGMICNGGVCVQCITAADCPGSDNECNMRTCSTTGVCGAIHAPSTKQLAVQTAGDCQVKTCDGNGGFTSVADNSDKPGDTTCTTGTCTAGMPSNPPLPKTAMCNANGGTHCNGAGACVVCNTPADCGTNSECKTYTCDNNVCSIATSPAADTPLMAGEQTPGDCHTATCDGMGNATGSIVNINDPFVDNDPCVIHTCSSGGTRVDTNKPEGTNCGGTSKCNSVGQCVGCLVDSDCSASDTECMKHVCNQAMGGLCQNAPVPNTHVMSTGQVTGNCKQKRCDGSGGILDFPDTSDLPDDMNPCTVDICGANGTPSHQDVKEGDSCGNGLVCNATGTCVGCNVRADCAAPDGECFTYSCSPQGTCDKTDTALGTATAGGQTAQDCLLRVCDGMGNAISQPDNSDKVDDGTVCTLNTCSGGVAGITNVAAGTICTDHGGQVCSANGTCVACNVAADCGTDSADGCTVHACVNNVCGFSNPGTGTLALTGQVAGDCKKVVCNGMGGTTSGVVDVMDVPIDGKACTVDACDANGNPSNPSLSAGTACADNGGRLCNSQGQCVSNVLAVVRAGSETTPQTLANTQTPVFIDIYTKDTGERIKVIALPTVDSGTQKAFFLSGTADSDGALALSGNSHFVTLGGYPTPTSSTVKVIDTTTQRLIAMMDSSFVVDTSRVVGTGTDTPFSTMNIRSVVTSDGTQFWLGGQGSTTTGGVWYLSPTSMLTHISGAAGTGAINVRVCRVDSNIVAGDSNPQLYCDSNTAGARSVYAVGTDLPTTALTVTPPLIVPTGTSPFGFAFMNLVDGDPSPDTLYIADDTTLGATHPADGSCTGGGILKFKRTANNGMWSCIGTLWPTQDLTNSGTQTPVSVRQFFTEVNGGNVTIYATTAGSTQNALIRCSDTQTSLTPSCTTLARSTSGNTLLRGVAPAPTP